MIENDMGNVRMKYAESSYAIYNEKALKKTKVVG